ncbi:MAG: phosphoglycerate dehydrogenase [Verrucomicrobiota bacterium]|jgi:D-3-phosphoglycerate dehydrogenase|nr:phosphoglycerate dehydrogenase [Verrucomicrobiota bacterium]
MKVLVCDNVSPKGVAHLEAQSELEVTVVNGALTDDLLADAEAIIVRSATKVTPEVMGKTPKLRVVGRAGVGVDNVDVEVATERGIVVMNTPSGNTISTAELTFSMLMALARKIPQAHMSMKSGKWDRKAFAGTELSGKTIGILGMGRIGSQVARRAIAFGMRVLAFDPYLSMSKARALQVELLELDEIFERSDFITVHMPLSDETRDMLGADAFSKMKDGVCVVNCARGGIINEADLVTAVKSGKVAGAALDVYDAEPLPEDAELRELPQVVMTPHLGASTKEAQESVGLEVAEAVTDYLVNGTVRNAVNMPSLDAKTYEAVKPYLELGEKLGRLVAQLAPNRNDRLVITYGGKAAEVPADPVTRYVLMGFLSMAGGQDVNPVNVRALASSLGLMVEEVKAHEGPDYAEWMHVTAHTDGEKVSAGGTFFGSHPRIVRLNGRNVECVPEGVLFLMNNRDKPGMVGYIGSLMGEHEINIGSMSLNRDEEGGEALTVLNLDSVPPDALLDKVNADPDISNVQVIKL